MSKYQLPYEKFMEDWLFKIERIEYLKLDEIKANVLPTLKNWRAYTNKIILVTMRHNKQNLMYQLDSLNLLSNLDEVIMCDSLTGSKKYDLIKHFKFDKAIFIGDTEEDIQTAKNMGIPSVGVLNGLEKKNI